MPLTKEQIAIVKATVPILETGGETLTKHFYKTLFAEHPEVKVFFNQAHQAAGTQPRALANSVLQYAKHIEDLSALGDLPAQIIQKHVSLNIPAEGYPIVGVTLLKAIREVLGAEVATDDVIDAWKAAYFQLADILIAAEETVYAERAAQPGGWRGKRNFIVERKEVETPEVTSFYFKPEDGKAILAYTAGQYLALALDIDGVEVRRNYSISDAPNGQYYRISVKREVGGVVSNFLHDKVNVGTVVSIFPPAGNFFLAPSTKPLVLISGGIGLTPVMAMLNQTLNDPSTASRPITYIHFTRNHKLHAFHQHIKDLASKHSNLTYYFAYDEIAEGCTEQPHHIGKLDHALLDKWLPANRDVDVYFLGPKPFMAAAKFLLKQAGVPVAQSKYEFFGPAEALAEPSCPMAGKASSASTTGVTCPFSGKH